MIEKGIESYLKGQITAVSNRVFPLKRPQKGTGSSLPALTYNRVSNVRTHSHDGYSDLARPRIQISVWSKSYSEIKTISKTIKEKLDGFKGTMGTITVQSCLFSGENERYENDTETYQLSIDFFIYYKE